MDKTVVCPYGFWGFKHVIEQPTQHGKKKEFENLARQVKTETEPVFLMLVADDIVQVTTKT